MMRLMNNAYSGLSAVQERIDTISNHIANLNTPGFKRKDATFEDVLTQTMKQPSKFQKDGRLTPNGLTVGNGTRLGRDILQFTQGNLDQTGNTYDLAIEGDAMFEIATSRRFPDGTIDTQTKYTRDGAFRLTTQPGDQENQYLVSQEGYFVRDLTDNPVKLPKGQTISFSSEGKIYANNGKETTEVGQLKIVRVLRPQALQPVGGNMYQLDPQSAQAVSTFQGNTPGTNQIAIHQGALELSNVDLTQEMTELILMQRAFQLNSRAMSTADQMMNSANNLRG